MTCSSKLRILFITSMLAVTDGSDAEEPTADSDTTAITAKADVAAPLVLVLRHTAVRSELRLAPAQAESLDKLLVDDNYPQWYVRDMNDAEIQAKRAWALDHVEKNLQSIRRTPHARESTGFCSERTAGLRYSLRALRITWSFPTSNKAGFEIS